MTALRSIHLRKLDENFGVCILDFEVTEKTTVLELLKMVSDRVGQYVDDYRIFKNYPFEEICILNSSLGNYGILDKDQLFIRPRKYDMEANYSRIFYIAVCLKLFFNKREMIDDYVILNILKTLNHPIYKHKFRRGFNDYLLLQIVKLTNRESYR